VFYRFCWYVGNLLMKVLFRWRVVGAEKLPPEGGTVIVANHANFFDPVIIGCCFQRKVHFMAKLELFRIPVLNWVITHLGAFPVKRGVADKNAFEVAFRHLDSGQVVALFPEGTRFKDGKLHPLRPGVAALAARGNALVLPMIIRNSNQIRFMRFPKIYVHIGDAFRIPESLAGSSEKEKMRQVATFIEERMRALWASSQTSPNQTSRNLENHSGSEAAL
jgi:1-acyl-sn-glycerol-3-phosphate acyltransferase